MTFFSNSISLSLASVGRPKSTIKLYRIHAVPTPRVELYAYGMISLSVTGPSRWDWIPFQTAGHKILQSDDAKSLG